MSWYTVGESRTGGRIESSFVTYDQGELLRYFAGDTERESNELLKISLTQTGRLGKDDNVGFVYVLNRTARDPRTGPRWTRANSSGQGAINCTNRRIFAWRMDMRPKSPYVPRGRQPGSAPTHPIGSRAMPSSRVHGIVVSGFSRGSTMRSVGRVFVLGWTAT